jgi:capsid protein
VDPVKEITAAILAKDNNIQTLAQIAAENGGDWETIIDQRAREAAREKEKGLTVIKNPSPSGTTDPGDETNNNQTRNG